MASMFVNYVKTNKCPYCKSKEFSFVDYTIPDEESVRTHYTCHTCGKIWSAVFYFSHSEISEEGVL